MRKSMVQLNDRWFRFLSIPLIAFLAHIVFYNRNDSGEERFGFWVIYLLSLAETLILWEAVRLGILYYRRRYPELDQTKQRIIRTLVVCTALTIIIRSATNYLYDKTLFWGYPFPLEAYFQSIAVGLLFVIIVGGVYEGIYYFRKWKDTAVEAEVLKKENLQTQLDSLKNQLSPHFLFNSLSSLSSLIEEDPQQAQAFVSEMSVVYRYLLQASEKELTSLRNEMIFVEAYSNMLRTRFPDSFRLSVNVEKDCWELSLPPLTLQLLIENAVKHNTALASQPLEIKITTDGARNLLVTNNLQPKTSAVISNKKGLANIRTKYRLLNQPPIEVVQTEGIFQVKVPLIKNADHGSIAR